MNSLIVNTNQTNVITTFNHHLISFYRLKLVEIAFGERHRKPIGGDTFHIF